MAMSRTTTICFALGGVIILPVLLFAQPTGSEAAPKTNSKVPSAKAICADGLKHEPVRVQIGTVEAVTQVGQEVSIPVRVKGVCNLAAFSFWLTFDSRVASLERVEQTPFLAGDPPQETKFTGLVAGTGPQTIKGIRKVGTGGVDGIGTLARLIFKGRTRGASRIDLVRLHLYDVQGQEISTDPRGVRLTVVPPVDRRRLRHPRAKLPGN